MSASATAGHRSAHHRGLALALGGLIIAAGFASFIFLVPQADTVTRSPLWIAVIWGALMVGYGVYRMIRGDSKLDHEHGGTNSEPQ